MEIAGSTNVERLLLGKFDKNETEKAPVVESFFVPKRLRGCRVQIVPSFSYPIFILRIHISTTAVNMDL
jgi:hypothetical protein